MKYIIFVDGEIKGYLDTEQEAKQTMYEIADNLIKNIGPTSSNYKILQEIEGDTLKIHKQDFINYFYNPLYIIHTITYKSVSHFKGEE